MPSESGFYSRAGKRVFAVRFVFRRYVGFGRFVGLKGRLKILFQTAFPYFSLSETYAPATVISEINTEPILLDERRRASSAVPTILRYMS